MVPFQTRPEIVGNFGVAASTHWLASQTAMRMMEIGGNAFDGACAAAFVLHVCEPHMNGPGGDVPIIFHKANAEKPQVLCGQGPAPAAASIAAFQNLGLDRVPGTGLLGAAIPGAFDAWMLLLRDHGRLELAQILQPAIDYAQNGCPMAQGASDIIAAINDFAQQFWPTTTAIYAPNNRAIAAGAIYTNPQLAATWTRLLRDASTGDRNATIDRARDIWRQGFIAAAIAQFVKTAYRDITGTDHAGLIDGDDLAGFSAHYEAPVSYRYHDHTIYKCDSWTQGPVLLQSLALLRHTAIADMDVMGAEFVHTITEAMKLTYADREAYYGDPNHVDVPLQALLGDDYNRQRARALGAGASRGFAAGVLPDGTLPLDLAPYYAAAIANQPVDSALSGFGGAEPTAAIHRSDTCHIDVIDRWGNMVSATPSGGWLQSSPIIPELGFCLGTRLQMCWLDPASPSALRPGKRPRATLSPSMVFRNDAPYMALGTPGGDQQDQWQLIFLLRHIHRENNLQTLIDMPSWHSEHWPSSFYPRHAFPQKLVIEDRFGAAVIDDLRARGHAIVAGDAWSEGRLSAAARANGWLRAAANARGMQGYAVGR